MAKNKLKTIGGFNIVNFNNETYYQILPDNKEAAMFQSTQGEGESCHSSMISSEISGEPAIYLNTKTGEKLENSDEKYAEFLARYFADEKTAEINSPKSITDFSQKYMAINRLLPVYEVEFKRGDGMTAFVDTTSSKLGTLVDTKKVWLQ